MTPEDHCCVVYFVTIDTIVGCVQECFEQEGYREYRKLGDILRNSDQGTDSDEVFHIYQDNLDGDLFNSQLSTFNVNFCTETIASILDILEIEKKSLLQKNHFFQRLLKLSEFC